MYNSNNLSSSLAKALTSISCTLGAEYSEYIERHRNQVLQECHCEKEHLDYRNSPQQLSLGFTLLQR